jgi:hypothetical protein
MTERLFNSAVTTLDKYVDRRGFLVRFALAGTAFTLAPVRFMLRAEPAFAGTSTCDGNFPCGTFCPAQGHCGADNYTTFCCTINSGNNSTCPTGTYVAGWWYCCPYNGSKLCCGTNKRYYLDCNAQPNSACSPHCANGSCSNRKTCCTCFKYGNCNTGIHPTTYVVCRLVRCYNPGTTGNYADKCSDFGGADFNTCSHEASCLPGCGSGTPTC